MANAGVDTGANTRCRAAAAMRLIALQIPPRGGGYAHLLRRQRSGVRRPRHRLRYSLGVIPVTRRNVVVK